MIHEVSANISIEGSNNSLETKSFTEKELKFLKKLFAKVLEENKEIQENT